MSELSFCEHCNALYNNNSERLRSNLELLLLTRIGAFFDFIFKFVFLSGEDGIENFEVQAKLAIVYHHFKPAKRIYIDNNQYEKALEMFLDMNKWEEGNVSV